MATKLNTELREAWRQRIDRQRRNGLTVAEFCRREDVPQWTFYSWKRKLQGEAQSKPKGPARQQPAPAVRPVPQAPSKTPFVQLPVSSTRTNPWIELVLVDGTIIRIPQQNLSALQTVLRALDGGSRWPVTEGARDA